MTKFLLIVFPFILVSFQTSNNVSLTDFRIRIEGKMLLSEFTTKYDITHDEFVVQRFRFDSKKNKKVTVDKDRITAFDYEKLVSFAKTTNWDTIPTELEYGMLDGFFYTVEILIHSKTYNFKIDSKYHPTIDSLFQISNRLLPAKIRTKYRLTYHNW